MNNDEIEIHVPPPVCCGMAKLRIMLKLVFTYQLLCAVGRKTYEECEISIHLPVPVRRGPANLLIMMKLGFTYL
jgi:hypothetical protein